MGLDLSPILTFVANHGRYIIIHCKESYGFALHVPFNAERTRPGVLRLFNAQHINVEVCFGEWTNR